jgi:GT2 family glycosyltransferase
MNAPDVSVIVVTYQSSAHVRRALESARLAASTGGMSLEVIVADNASTDGTLDVVESVDPTARLIRRTVNDGFGVANNDAFAIARGGTWVLLNPDAELSEGALRSLREFLDAHPRAGVAAPSIAGPGRVESAGMRPGLRSMAAHLLLLNRLAARMLGPNSLSPWLGFAIPRGSREPRRVEWASAAAVALRPEAVRAVGGFDPAIFLYGEDIDLCERLATAGWESWLVPSARASHLIAGSQGRVSSGWIDGLDRLYGRRAGRLRLVAFDLLLAVGLGLRAAVGSRSDPEARLQRQRMAEASRRARSLALAALTS